MTTLLAFGRNDAISVRRDPMFRFLVFAPLVYLALVRFVVPALTDMLADRFAFDLTPYLPLILSLFLVLGPALILSALAGLLMVEEKDARTLAALRVTPASLTGFAVYRGAAVVTLVLAYVLVTVGLSGYFEARLLPGTIAAGVCSGLLAAMIMVLMTFVSQNKLEALALMKAIGLLIGVVPILPWFLATPWEYAFAPLPSYWPAKIFWLAAAGESVWLHAVVGIAYCAALFALLVRAFQRRPD